MSLIAEHLLAGHRPDIPVLDDVGIEIARGPHHRLTGPSGAGKTTLARVCALLHRPWSGRVSVDGVVVSGGGPRFRRTRGGRSRCCSSRRASRRRRG